MCTRTQEKGAVTPQEIDPDLPVSVQKSLTEAWVVGSYCSVGGTVCSSTCVGPFEGGCRYLHYLHHSLASGQTTEREHSPAHQQKIGLKRLLSMALLIRTRPSFPYSQSLPAGSFHKPLILLHQRGDRMKNHSHRKLTDLITWTTALSNSMKL